MSDIIWQDPPADGRSARRSKHDEFRAALRGNPGRWALLGNRSPAVAYTFRRSDLWNGFEIAVRNVKSGRGDVYARFVGDES